jgi:hypothetical protein
MKKLNLEKLKLAAEDVLQRSELAGIYGGSGGITCQWVCDCGDGSFSLWHCTDDPTQICYDLYQSGGHCSGQQ